jgi:hypothetical protein
LSEEENETDEEEIFDDVEEKLKDKKKKITVEHVFKDQRGLPEDAIENAENAEKLKAKLNEREAQLAALALKEFQKEKDVILDSINDPERREQTERFIGDNPDRLEIVKYEIGVSDEDDDGTEPVPPSGKVRASRKTKGDSDIQDNVIGELYKIRMKKATSPDEMKEQAVADTKIAQMFDQLEQGLRDRPRGDSYRFTVAQCHACGAILTGKDAKTYASTGVCPVCGHKPKEGGH